jgi:hypothetical protein
MGGAAMVRLQSKHTLTSDPKRYWITLTFTLVCFGFTIMSFLKANRKQAVNRKSSAARK